VPSPAKFGLPKKDGKGVHLNARSDNAMTVWRRALFSRRCVVPSTGYYEWMHEGKKATDKFLFRRPGEKMLYMAGMLGQSVGKDGVTRDAFVILTTDANDSVSPVHHRMPLILMPKEQKEWLANDAFVRLALKREGPELVALPAV